MKIAGLDIHPAAELYPLISEPELAELAADIKAKGQLHPIVKYRNQVLDGRNRLLACEFGGIKPRFETWEGDSPTEYVLSANSNRRHLTTSQKAMIAAKAAVLLKNERKLGRPKKSAEVRSFPKGKVAERAAKSQGVSTRHVEKAIALKKADPKLAEKVFKGELTLDQADHQIRRAVQVKQAREYKPPAGVYSVIVDDPAWPFEDGLKGVKRELPYPVQTIEDICAKPPPAAKDCALFLWAPNSHVIDGTVARVLAAWGFTPKAMITWIKPKIGLGRYVRNCTEQLVIATRGKPVFVPGNVPSWFKAPAGKHSEKPDEAFAIIEKICPAKKRIELHARKPRKGWATSGSELPEEEQSLEWKIEHAHPGQCFLCRKPFEGREPNDGGMLDYIGIRHNRPCTKLTPADEKLIEKAHKRRGEFYRKISCETHKRIGKACPARLGKLPCMLKPGHPGEHRDDDDCTGWRDDEAEPKSRHGAITGKTPKRAGKANVPSPCDVQGCTCPKRARGLCGLHYQASRRHILASHAKKAAEEKALQAEQARYVSHRTSAPAPKKKRAKKLPVVSMDPQAQLWDSEACRVCGCTEERACMDPERGTCCWVEEDLCNYCGEALDDLAVKMGYGKDRHDIPKSVLKTAEKSIRDTKRSKDEFAEFDRKRAEVEAKKETPAESPPPKKRRLADEIRDEGAEPSP